MSAKDGKGFFYLIFLKNLNLQSLQSYKRLMARRISLNSASALCAQDVPGFPLVCRGRDSLLYKGFGCSGWLPAGPPGSLAFAGP